MPTHNKPGKHKHIIIIDAERRAGSGAAGDRKNIDFSLKTFRKVSILYPGSLGTVSGRFWGPRGVQIPLTLELKDDGRWRPRVPDELFGTLLPADRANFGGSPGAELLF